MNRCAYCGTELTTDGISEAVDGRIHSASSCREYLKAALNACEKECARLRQTIQDQAGLIGKR